MTLKELKPFEEIVPDVGVEPSPQLMEAVKSADVAKELVVWK